MATTTPQPSALVPPDAPAVLPAPVASPLVAAGRGDDAPPPVPVPLRPMTTADLVDGGFAVLKSRPRSLAICAAVAVLPVSLLAAWSQRGVFGGAGIGQVLEDPTLASSSSSGSTDLAYLAALLDSVAVSLVAIAVVTLLAARYAGRDPSTGELLGAMARRSPAVLAAWVLVHLAEAVGLLGFGIGAAYVMGALLVTVPALVTEGIGPIAAVRRSWQLTARRRWPMVGIGLVTWLVVEVLAETLALVPTVLALVIGTEDGWILLAAGDAGVSLLTTPLVAAIAGLAYLDLRVRFEGLDVELAAVAAFGRDG